MNLLLLQTHKYAFMRLCVVLLLLLLLLFLYDIYVSSLLIQKVLHDALWSFIFNLTQCVSFKEGNKMYTSANDEMIYIYIWCQRRNSHTVDIYMRVIERYSLYGVVSAQIELNDKRLRRHHRHRNSYTHTHTTISFMNNELEFDGAWPDVGGTISH